MDDLTLRRNFIHLMLLGYIVTTALLDQFSKDAVLFPHMLDIASDQILLSHLTQDDYRAASFLDGRIITPQLQRQVVSWDIFKGYEAPQNPAPHYIFHIGHVGSTLISRLLGAHDNILALREPQILRSLADISRDLDAPQAPWSEAIYKVRRGHIIFWLSRSFHPQQRVMIKASSFVSEIANQIWDGGKGLCLYASLPRYLETIFGGEASHQEAQQLAGPRLIRLHKRLGPDFPKLWQLERGQIFALGWLCEMITLMQAAKVQTEGKALWMDFDGFLKSPAENLSKAAQHFEISFNTDEIEALVNGPIMHSYSKAPEHDYSAGLRRDVLAQARQNYGSEIDSAIRWVERLAKTYAPISKALDFTS